MELLFPGNVLSYIIFMILVVVVVVGKLWIT